jgi:hypothetical protein
MTKEQAQIKLDIDSEHEPDLSIIHGLLRRSGYAIQSASMQRSPSGEGWHVRINVMPRPHFPFEVVALQAICGSDPYREAMQMNRAREFSKAPKHMRDAWNVLYLAHSQRQRHVKLSTTEECVP